MRGRDGRKEKGEERGGKRKRRQEGRIEVKDKGRI